MGSDKHETSDTSSDDQETSRTLSPNGSKEGLGRSYECNFCKRGFTNAQALGGHMNIHRKDKAKAKQHMNTYSTVNTASPKPNKDDHSMVTSNSFDHQEAQYFGTSFGYRTVDHHGYQFMPSNPNYQWALAASQFDTRALHEDQYLRVNLNLGIGTSEMENNNIESTKVGNEDWIENDVDLELRLGHYP